ncbi:MAG: hypothetical protein ACYCT7_04395 [bacterium]
MVNINTVKGWLDKANHDMEVLKHNDLPKDIVITKINLLEQNQTSEPEDAFIKDLNNRLNKSKDLKR